MVISYYLLYCSVPTSVCPIQDQGRSREFFKRK